MSQKQPVEATVEFLASQHESLPSASEETAAAEPVANSEMPQFAPPTQPGEIGRLGKYRIQKELGRGGMGAVYLAFDERLQRQIAFKVMLPKFAANANAKDRFLREARAAARISSDHVVNIHEADEIDGTPYIALQLLQGYPLDEYLKKKGSPSLAQIIRIGKEMAIGLAAAHKLGLVHRDIKPGNVWLEAPNGRVKILDFGLAKPVEGAESAELTAMGAIVGTPAYMAPEQGRGEMLDGRADLFSLGCVLYRLCTGKPPFARPTLMSILIAIATEEPTPVRELNPNVPEPLAELIHRLLAKNAADRPANAQAVVKEFDGIIEPMKKPGEVIPHVFYAPMAVSVQESNPFADIDTVMDSETAEPHVEVAKLPPRKFPAILVGSLVFALITIVLAGFIVIKITNKDGTVTEIKVPEGAKIEVDGKTIKPDPKKMNPAATPDRKAAEYVLSIGGSVSVNGQVEHISAAELPREAFQLTVVNLAATGVSDAGLANFKDCKNLTYLGLSATKVSDAGLANFKDCKKLTFLGLNNTQVGDAGLAHFKDSKNLTELALSATQVSDAGLANFKDCKNLTALYLSYTSVSDAGMASFKDCKNLTVLHLSSTQAGDAGLANFKDCKNLSQILLKKTKVTAAKFEELKKAFPKCKIESDHGTYEPPVDVDRKAAEYVLSIGGTVGMNGENKEIKAAAELPREAFQLTHLHLQGNAQVSDAGLANFKDCRNLTGLNLHKTKVGDAGLAHFKECKSLTYLDLTNTQVSDAGLANFKDCKNLTFLNLWATQVSDAGLAHFKDCKNLTGLNLSGTQVGDAGLAHFKDCKNLTGLNLSGTQVGDAGLANLSDCKNLTYLGLHGCMNVGDAGLASFKDCKNLIHLVLLKTKVTAANFEELKKAFPKCRIESDYGTYEPPVDADRKAAVELRNHKFTLRINTPTASDVILKPADPLPMGPFVVLGATPPNEGLLFPEDFVRTVLIPAIAPLSTFENFSDYWFVTSWTPDDLAKLAAAPVAASLWSIRGGFDLTVENLATLKKFPKLYDLGCQIGPDSALLRLKELRLSSLALGAPLGTTRSIGADGWAALTSLRLSELNLFYISIDEAAAKRIAAMKLINSKGVAIKDCPGAAEHISHLAVSQSIQSLTWGNDVSDADLLQIDQFVGLRLLTIWSSSKITEPGVRKLAEKLPHCKIRWKGGVIEPVDYRERNAAEYLLSIGGTVRVNEQDSDIKVVAELPKVINRLDMVKLTGSKFVTDSGLSIFNDCKNLVEIDISNTAVTDAGLAHLKDCKKLRTIRLMTTHVTDAGLDHFKDCKDLTALDLKSTKITAAKFEELKKAFPKSKIESDHGTYEPK